MKELWKNIRIVMRMRHQKHIAKLLLLMIVCACLEVCGVSAVLPTISAILDKEFMHTNQYASFICSFLGIHTYQGFIALCLLLLLIVFVVKNWILLIKTRYHADYALMFQYEIRKDVFHKYLKKNYSFFFSNHSSEIYKRLLDDVGKVYATFDSVLKILTEGIVSVFLFVAVFIIDWKLSLLVFCVTLSVFLILTWMVRPVVRKSGENANKAQIIRNKWIHQALTGIKTVKITRKEEFFESKTYHEDLIFSEAEKKHLVLSAIPKIILEMLCIIILITVVIMISADGNRYEVIIPQISAIGVAILKLIPGINTIISNIISIQYRIPAIQRVAEISEEEDFEEPKGDFPTTYHKEIEIQGIFFQYDENGRYIFKDTDLTIPIGKMIGIMGSSGEGKTTFADILLGLLTVEDGKVLVDGVDIRQDIDKWQKSIGYVTQNVFLLDDSVKANIAFGIDDEEIDEELLWNSMAKAHIDEYIRSLPEGVNTRVGERGIKFSVGQCQRIGIARALYAKPQILVFDEATSALDAETESAVINSINELYGKHTILIISHHAAALKRCDKIYKIHNGSFIRER